MTFKVVNGTWSDGTSSNIKVSVTKGESLTRDQIPTGMKPNSGYEGGSWDKTPNITNKLNSNVTYTYTFTKSGDTEPEDEDCILYFDSNGGTEFKKIDNGNDSFRINPYSDSEYGQHIPSRPGYRFTGWYRDEDLENRISESTKINVNSIMTIYAGWERTSVPSMLNGDDHYAYIQGYADGTVRPNANITRAQVATIFFRLLDDDTRAKYWSSKNDFSDVSADKWYNNAVSTLSNMGVIGGYADGTFRPDAPISRAEFAKIAVSFTQNTGSATYNYFTDVKTTDWFAPYVTAAKDAGLIEGYSDGSFKPESKITRAEACAIVNRTLGRKPSKAHMKISDRIDWPDVQTTDWFYEAIMEATNSHTYQMGKRVETWNDKLPQRDWAALETGWANAYTGNGGEVR